MKKLILTLAIVLSTSACVTHLDVSYEQIGNNCIYSHKLKGESIFGYDRVLEKTISYEDTQCSIIITSDTKNAINKEQSITTRTHIIDKPAFAITKNNEKQK